MANIRTTFIWRPVGTGPKSYDITETHWHIAAGNALGAVDEAVRLANLRTNLMGRNVEMVSVRLSDDAVLRDSILVLPATATDGDTRLKTFSTDKDLRADQPNSAVLLRLLNSPGIWKNMYLAGIPDDVIVTGDTTSVPPVAAGPNFDVNQPFRRRYNAWKAAISNAGAGANPIWGFRSRIFQPPRVIKDWSNAAPGVARLQFTIDAPAIARPAPPGGVVQVGDRVQIRLASAPASPIGPPRGIWIVQTILSLGGGTEYQYTLRNTEAFDSALVINPGTVEYVHFGYLPYADVQIRHQTTRKRGGRRTAARGRSRRRRSTLA